MSNNLKIVHESEIQRQHVRVEMSGSAKIGEKVYKIKDVSVGGFSVYATEKMDSLPAKAKLIFPFNKYALQLDSRVELVNDNRDLNIATFKFVELDAAQISLISYIINARMTGTLVNGGDLLSVAARNNHLELKPRSAGEKKGTIANVKRILPTLIVSAIGLAGLAFLISNAYENSSVIRSYQGIVEANEVVVRTHVEGTVHYLISEQADKVTKGQPLVSIEHMGAPKDPMNPQAQDVTILSPCDCFIEEQLVKNGEFRAYGERLFTLAPVDSLPWVSALVAPEKAHHLRLQDDVNIRVTGEGGFINGNIMEIKADSMEKPYTIVKIRPEKPLPADMIGRPAYVEFTTYN